MKAIFLIIGTTIAVCFANFLSYDLEALLIGFTVGMIFTTIALTIE